MSVARILERYTEANPEKGPWFKNEIPNAPFGIDRMEAAIECLGLDAAREEYLEALRAQRKARQDRCKHEYAYDGSRCRCGFSPSGYHAGADARLRTVAVMKALESARAQLLRGAKLGLRDRPDWTYDLRRWLG